MEKTIFRIALILISLGLCFASYHVYLREKYSGKKYVWSNNDIRNNKLRGYHWHGYTFFFSTFTVYFIITNLYEELTQKVLKINTLLVFIIFLIYGLASHFRQKKLEGRKYEKERKKI